MQEVRDQATRTHRHPGSLRAPSSGAELTTLLHTAVKGDKGKFREHGTWKWFELHDSDLDRTGWDVQHVIITPGDQHMYDYDNIVRYFWAQNDDLLFFERDMVPLSFAQLRELVDCPEPSCAIDYPLTRCFLMDVEARQGTVGRFPNSQHVLVCVEHQAILSMMRSSADAQTTSDEARWNDGTWTHCDMPPLGLTRIRKSILLRTLPDWAPTVWLDVDQVVGKVLSAMGVRTHIHYPMARQLRRFRPEECCYVATLKRDYPILAWQDVLPQHRARILQAHRAERRHTAFVKVIV
jgi:hypothetical protein